MDGEGRNDGWLKVVVANRWNMIEGRKTGGHPIDSQKNYMISTLFAWDAFVIILVSW